MIALGTQHPDILVSSKADLIALRGEDGKLVVSTRQKERYAVENWLRMNGQNGERPERWPSEGAMRGMRLICDDTGCRGEIKGYKVAVAHEASAWQEDCGWADIVIASVPVRDCGAGTVIDRFSVYRHGAHALYLSPDLQIETVEETRGERIWAGY